MEPNFLHKINDCTLKDAPDRLPKLFPDSSLPLPPSEIFEELCSGSSPLYQDFKWVGCPDLTAQSTESQLVEFLNTLGQRMEQILHATKSSLPPTKRRWMICRDMEDASAAWKTSIILTSQPRRRWSNVHVHAELESSTSDVVERLANGAYHIFSAQDNRRFVISIAFLGENIQLYIFDRSGLVITTPFHIHNEPQDFVRVLAALMFADRATLGYDPSIVENNKGGRYIEVAGNRYDIIETLYISDGVCGRGTVCWHVCHNDKFLVIKDAWVVKIVKEKWDPTPCTEAETLERIKGLAGVPLLHDVDIVTVNGEWGTDALRICLRSRIGKIDKRIHQRLVLQPFGQPLSTFASRKELISVLIDAVKAHWNLWDTKTILHRDISVDNILLVHPDDMPPSTSGTTVEPAPQDSSSPPLRRALLIDMKHALRTSSAQDNGPRKGTLPFMAIQLLLKGGHQLAGVQLHHHLESFLYVFIWLCVHYAGPDNAERQNFDISQSRLSCWVNGETYEKNGLAKDATMRAGWKTHVLDSFSPYFEPLKPCATAWRQLWLDGPVKFTHNAVLGVLEDALASLDATEDWSAKDDPEGYGKKMGKRKREIDEGKENGNGTGTGGHDRPTKVIKSQKGKPSAPSSAPHLPKQKGTPKASRIPVPTKPSRGRAGKN
ncbi:hypothetical protein R3P38DRAFT_2890495 [Favolaschia claudopus]|uniref:Fungal-type protein kinase domain-containing protein n=1 Tax=Favolaschia claudopus TaxID=2862362 RepID=A0AAW0CTS9_9AGAR